MFIMAEEPHLVGPGDELFVLLLLIGELRPLFAQLSVEDCQLLLTMAQCS